MTLRRWCCSCARPRRATSRATRWSQTVDGSFSSVSAGRAPASAALLELNDVHKSFGHVDVIKGVTIKVSKGERVVMFGPSGVGMSTLLRLVTLIEVVEWGALPTV